MYQMVLALSLAGAPDVPAGPCGLMAARAEARAGCSGGLAVRQTMAVRVRQRSAGCSGGAAAAVTYQRAGCSGSVQTSTATTKTTTVETVTTQTVMSQTTTAVALIAAHNEIRVRAGLRPLAAAADLTQAAGVWAADMIRRGFRHSRGVAENIAMGQVTVTEVMGSWQRSPGHLRNILGAGYTSIGVGVAYDSGGRAYWCVQFR